MKTYPISVSMTPAFYDPEHMLLRTQLRCLSNQTCKDFDVWLIDPHYKKRRSIIPEFAERYGLDIKHIPYRPNTHVAKVFDCAIFNAAYCYSPAPTNVRYSCYRFVRPGFIQAIADAPEGVNVDFYMLAVGPCIYEERDRVAVRAKHLTVWNFQGEEVNWDLIPCKSGYTEKGVPNNDMTLSLATWWPFADRDTDVIPVPLNIYGNLAWRRDQWLAINGTNEVITNAAHWEDIDFDNRANMAGQRVVRRAHLLYRLHHQYGNFSQRSNVQVDVPLFPPCPSCARLMINCGDWDFGARLQNRIDAGEVKVYDEFQAWVCKECKLSGAVYGASGILAYLDAIRARGMVRAPVLREEKIGRNLQRLAEAMDKVRTLPAKAKIYHDSWTNPIYYEA